MNNKLTKTERVLAFEFIGNDQYLNAVFRGLVFCLSPEEACSLLDITFQQEYRKRMVLKNKIYSDIILAYLNCHDQLVNSLMAEMATLPANKRQSAGYCLTYFLSIIPTNKVQEVVSFFLRSKWKQIRDRGYKYLHHNWDDVWAEQVEYNLYQHNELLAARLAIEHFSVEFLKENWQLVFSIVKEHYLVRRLFIKIGSVAPEKLHELKKIDPISYVYVLVKLNMSLNENEAIQIFKENLIDERLELLIWCFGQMKLWEVLEYVHSKKAAVGDARHEAISGRYRR
ncbi:MAG: hypothetical protein GX962_00955 [Epulopiscium sp.]|nr:hypothetical protein [Candidatus Epulonipiscium sp.]